LIRRAWSGFSSEIETLTHFHSRVKAGLQGVAAPCRSAMESEPGGLTVLASSPFSAAEDGKKELCNNPAGVEKFVLLVAQKVI